MGTHPIFESDFDCLTEKMNLSMDEIRQILSEVLKLLATPEFQTQLEKSRQSSANDAVALLQSALPIISRAQQETLTARGMPGQQAILDFNLKVRSYESDDQQISQMAQEIRGYILPPLVQ